MKSKEFKAWLQKERCFSTSKQVSDCASRVKRAERCLSTAVPQIKDFDSAFEIDGGCYVRLLLSHRGMTPEMGAYTVDLPIGTNQMDPIASAVRKYFLFLEDTI